MDVGPLHRPRIHQEVGLPDRLLALEHPDEAEGRIVDVQQVMKSRSLSDAEDRPTLADAADPARVDPHLSHHALATVRGRGLDDRRGKPAVEVRRLVHAIQRDLVLGVGHGRS